MPEVLANVLNPLPRARLFEQGASWILPPAQQDKEKLRQAIVRLIGNGQWAVGWMSACSCVSSGEQQGFLEICQDFFQEDDSDGEDCRFLRRVGAWVGLVNPLRARIFRSLRRQ